LILILNIEQTCVQLLSLMTYLHSPLLHNVKQEISGLQDRIGVIKEGVDGIQGDTQEIKEITSQVRNFQIGNTTLTQVY
jgi:hypothetical protein